MGFPVSDRLRVVPLPAATRKIIIGALMALAATAYSTAGAGAQSSNPPQAAPAVPSWPCGGRKVLLLSPGAFWSGPEVEEMQNWKDVEGMPSLVRALASRKVSMEDATKRIAAFAKNNESDRRQKLTTLFVGVFSETNKLRAEIVDGIERFEKRRQARLGDLQSAKLDLDALSAKEGRRADEDDRIAALTVQVRWLNRVYAEPERSIRLACEASAFLEERLFEVSKLIEDAMPANG